MVKKQTRSSSQHEVKMSYLSYNKESGYLLPPYLKDLIPADHVARVLNQVVDLLDICDLTSQVGLIATRCVEDVVFIWLYGMQKPDFSTISYFRKNNI